MPIATIRANLRNLVATALGAGAEVQAYPPDAVAAGAPAAYLGDASAPLVMGAREVRRWRLPLTVLFPRGVQLADASLQSEALIEQVLTAVRANITLSGACQACSYVEIKEGEVLIGQQKWYGWTLVFDVHEHVATTIT